MNRINPDLFATCFSSWVAECQPNRADLAAIDGRTSRGGAIANAAWSQSMPWDAMLTSRRAISMPVRTISWRSRIISRPCIPRSNAISTQHLAMAGPKSEHFPSIQIAGLRDGYFRPEQEAQVVASTDRRGICQRYHGRYRIAECRCSTPSVDKEIV
jgi:hypothetical protein